MAEAPVIGKALWSSIAALSLFLSSCGASREFYIDVDASVAQGNYRTAIEQVKAGQPFYGDKSTVLYNLDLGLLYHYAGEPDSSATRLFAAEREMEDLYTKSISLAAASMLLNDNVLHYEGEDVEKVLLNVFLALNYALENEPDEALVEARKVDIKLRQFAKQYDAKNAYQDDAFIRYVAGVLYESAGEINDAFISYRKAYDAYGTYEKVYGTRTPSFLLDDLVRTSTLLAFDDEAETYRKLGGAPYRHRKQPQGMVLVIAYCGRGPIKEEVRPTVSIADDQGTIHTFQVALPKCLPRYVGNRAYPVSVASVQDSTRIVRDTTETAEDITAIVGKALEDRLTMIYLKSGGRALMKFLAAEKAKKEIKKNDDVLTNVLGSLAIDAALGATERADVRSWRTLPAQIQLSRILLDPGEYTVQVTSSDGALPPVGQTARVSPGRATLVIVKDVR